VRYIGDPSRQEALNIGVIVWDSKTAIVQVDEKALTRVVSDNPRLAKGALDYVPAFLDEWVASFGAPSSLTDFFPPCPNSHVVFSECRYARLPENGSLADLTERIVELVVTPRPRGGGGGNDIRLQLKRHFAVYMKQNLIYEDYAFERSQSGAERHAQFFANSATNMAIDALNLSLTRPYDIVQRADAQAFKVEDILKADHGLRYLVCCGLAHGFTGPAETARRILESAGAKVAGDSDEAAALVAGEIESAKWTAGG
jgi:hypothetical protein